MKIWHDDIRKPPDRSWIWVRTNAQARRFLREPKPRGYEGAMIKEISLDHDLGLDHLDPDADPDSIYFAGPSRNETGLDLVNWMCEKNLVPPKVTIHSMNPVGAQNMAARLNHFGHNCTITPYLP